MKSKEIVVVKGQSIKKYNMTVTKDYPKTKSSALIRNYYNGDRQNQEDHQ